MPANLTWDDAPASIDCRICGFSGDGTLRVTLSGATPAPIRAVHCPECGSAELDTVMHDLDVPDAVIDQYIENGASIEAIGGSLLAVDPATVRRFIDVGCNYGFGVHLAQEILGWHAEGIEPGNPGLRGAGDLGITIHNDYLTRDSAFESPFDLALASEVLEHVDDPLEFLVAIISVLQPDGRLIITTPAAEVLDGSSPDSEVIIALSPGFHRSLCSAAGLTSLLRRAGFSSAVVIRDGRTLRAVASVSTDEQLRWGEFDFPEGALARYYADWAGRGKAGSALASGMASRHFRALVNAGAFKDASVSFKRAAASIQGRSQLDLEDPNSVITAIRGGAPVPWNLIPVAYHAGMMKLVGERDAQEAIRYFDLTLAAAARWEAQASVLDGDSVDLRLNALRHRSLAIAMASPSAVPHSLEELAEHDGPDSTAAWLLKAFVQLVSQGSLVEAQVLAKEATLVLDRVENSGVPGSKQLVMDSLLCLATLELQVGSPKRAIEVLEHALSRLESTHDGDPAHGSVDRIRVDLLTQVDAARKLAAELRWVDTASDVVGGVSVIMPVYNGARYLVSAVASVIDQDLKPLELVIVDDGSIDGSVRLLEGIEAEFPIIVITQGNSGQSSARNVGVRAARGEYLAFIDQDDEWRHNHLSTLLPHLQGDQSCGWAFSDFDQVDSHGQTVTRNFIAEVGVAHPKRSLIAVLAEDLMVLPSASVIRRRTVVEANGFDPRLIGYEDDDLFVKAYRRGWGHSFDPSSTVRYRVHVRGSSATPSFLRSRLVFLDTLLETIPDDHRIDFYLSHDVIIPRFYRATIRDYVDALAFRDWSRAVAVVSALGEIAGKLDRLTWRRKLILRVMRHPRHMRGFLLAAERMPRWMLPRRISEMFFGHRSIVRSDR